MDLEAGAKKAKRKNAKRSVKKSAKKSVKKSAKKMSAAQRSASAKRGAAKRSIGRKVAVLDAREYKNHSASYLGTNLSAEAFERKLNALEKKSKGHQNSKYMKQRQAMIYAMVAGR
jgi:hypothetical protein